VLDQQEQQLQTLRTTLNSSIPSVFIPILKMGLFSNKNNTPPPQTITTTTTHHPEKRSSGMFGRSKNVSPPPTSQHQAHHNEKTGGLFSKRRSNSVSPPPSATHNTKSHGGLLHRNNEDPSIANARARVMSAEAAEREADKALVAARASVRQAREEVKRLELEAAEEARLAKIKQGQAASLSKRGKALGRKWTFSNVFP
jgi:hypothetical protein